MGVHDSVEVGQEACAIAQLLRRYLHSALRPLYDGTDSR